MKEPNFFMKYVNDMVNQLGSREAGKVFAKPEECAIFSVDVTNAFCREGNLASERVAGIIQPIAKLMTMAWNMGLTCGGSKPPT